MGTQITLGRAFIPAKGLGGGASMNPIQAGTIAAGSLDGTGAGDHDIPYRFFRPRATVPYPFSTRQYARLLILRSRVEAGLLGPDDRPVFEES
jgi:hypothetical protein